MVDALGGLNTTYFDRPHHEVISVPHGECSAGNAVTLATHHLQTGNEITQAAVTAGMVPVIPQRINEVGKAGHNEVS